MSAHISEASANIAQIVEGVLRGEGKCKYVVCDSSADETKLFELYHSAIHYLEAWLGRPNYSGRGGDYPNGNEGADPGVFIEDYSRSIAIAWWRTKQGVYAALVSGHDADTLRCFTLIFQKSTP